MNPKQPLADADIYNPTSGAWIATRDGRIIGVFDNRDAAKQICEINAAMLYDEYFDYWVSWTDNDGIEKPLSARVIAQDGKYINYLVVYYPIASTFHYYD